MREESALGLCALALSMDSVLEVEAELGLLMLILQILRRSAGRAVKPVQVLRS